jgi:nucleoside-diphosphate-sugar epimerase
LVFGTGAIGLAVTEALQRRGQTGIELVNRSGSAPVVDAVEVVGGDASDAVFAVEVPAGARVVNRSAHLSSLTSTMTCTRGTL